jgi:hypothetical protein
MTPGSPWLAALRRGHCMCEILTGWLLAALLLMPVVGGSQETAPAWWAQRGVIQPGAGLDDYAVINQGQLKNLVAAAVAEMNANLTGGAGAALNSTVSAWNASPQTADDFAAVNIGQLKATALPVYQRLLAAGSIAALPSWANAQAEGGDDFALANLGQAKSLFAFAVPFQDDPNIERESLDALPEGSPFIIKYHDWQSGQVRPGQGESSDPPVMATVYTGTAQLYRWQAREQATQRPLKITIGSPTTVERDSLEAIEAWKTMYNSDPPAYFKHSTAVEVIYPEDVAATHATIYVYKDTVYMEDNGTVHDSYREEVTHFVLPQSQVETNTWVAEPREPVYELSGEWPWKVCSYESALVEAHWFSQVAAGPVTGPVAGWEAAPEVATSNVQTRLSDPGEIIPHEDLNLPTAGGVVATARAVLSSVQQTYENGAGQTVTSTRYTGARSQGYVSIAWHPDLAQSLTLAEKQAWLGRFRVVQKTTTTPAQGAASSDLASLPLSHYLSSDTADSSLIRLSPTLQDGTQQEIELHVTFLGLPVQPPLVLKALFAQQEVAAGGMAPFGLIVILTQGGEAVVNRQVTFEMFQGEGGIMHSASSTDPQPHRTVQTDTTGVAFSQFRASTSPGYSWVRASAEGAVSQWFQMKIGGGGSEEFPANPPGTTGVNFAYDTDGDGDSDAAELADGTDPEDPDSYIPDWKFRSINIQFYAEYDQWKADNRPDLQPPGQTPGIYNWFTARETDLLSSSSAPIEANYVEHGPLKPALPSLIPYVKPQPDAVGWNRRSARKIPWKNEPNFNPFPITYWDLEPPIEGSGANHFFLYAGKSEISREPVDEFDIGPNVGNQPRCNWISTAVRLELQSSKPRPRSFSALAVVERTRISYPLVITTEIVDSFTLTLPAGAESSEPIVLSYEPVMHATDFYTVKYVPFEVDNLTRNTHTGEISMLGTEIAEALPVPEVDVKISQATIVGYQLNILVTCKVRDPISELPHITPVNQLQFYINGALVESVGNLSAQASGAFIPVWQDRKSEVEIQRTFTIPLSGGIQTVSVQTSDNEAGNHGVGAAYIIVGKNRPLQQTVADSFKPKITLHEPLSGNTTDTITLQFPGHASVILTEAEPGANYFTGTAQVNNTPQTAGVRIKSEASLNPSSADSFAAVVVIGSANKSYYEGWWRESGPDTGEFLCEEFHPAGNGSELFYIDTIKPSELGAVGFVQPFVTRFTAPPIFKTLISEDGPLKLTLNGEEIPLVAKPGFIPDDDSADHLYVAKDSNPRLFTAFEEAEGTPLAPGGIISEQKFKIELQKRGDDTVVWDQDHTIVHAPPPFLHMEAGSIVPEPEPAIDPSTLTLAEFEQEMLVYYFVLFGEYGGRLYNEASDLGVTLRYGNVWFDFDNWDIDNYLQGAYNEGKRPVIILDRADLKTPARAANALFAALHHLFHSYFTAAEIQQRTPPPEPSPYFSAEDAALYQELSQGRYDRIGQALGDIAFALEMGISIASPATGVVLSVSHISDAWRDGETTSAYAQAALLLLPLAAKFAVRAGKPLTVRLGRFADGVDFVIPPTASKELITALQTIASGERVVAMRQLRPLIENGEVSADWIELWYKAGWLKFTVKKKGVLITEGVAIGDPYKVLEKGILQRQGLAVKPASTRTHHDLALGTHSVNGVEVDLTLEFLKRGIDPNDGMIAGRFMDIELHRLIHGNIRGIGKSQWGDGNGSGGPFNYQWWKFFDDNKDATSSEILSFVDDLVEATSDLTARTLDDIAWPYPNPSL